MFPNAPTMNIIPYTDDSIYVTKSVRTREEHVCKLQICSHLETLYSHQNNSLVQALPTKVLIPDVGFDTLALILRCYVVLKAPLPDSLKTAITVHWVPEQWQIFQ
jgi:hypothetical protein